METAMRYFGLHQDIYFEKGASGGALYDFMRRRVHPISPSDTQILEQLQRDVAIDEVRGAPPAEVEALVQRLTTETFGTRHAIAQRRDRYVPALKLKMSGLVEPPLVIRVLHLSLTASCTLDCAGCGDPSRPVWQGCNGCERWPGVPRNAAWSRASVDQFVDELGALEIRNVFFSGGDPFAEPDLLEHAVRRLRDRNPAVGIIVTTNGTALTPAMLDRVAGWNVKLNFAILGETPEEYAAVCGDPGGFDAVIQAIAGAQVRAIPFTAALRLDGIDAAAAARRRQWASTLGAQKLFVFEPLHVQEDGGVAPAASLPTIGPARVPQVGPEQFFQRRDQHPCLHGNIAVSADLSVRPCPMIEDRALGHVGLEPLRNVFGARRHERHWQMTKNDVAGCNACEFRYACADCAAVDLAKRRQPALHAALCAYDPARASWQS
jgi:radical SAM protein with 4Fe4S-binding SPASM domain